MMGVEESWGLVVVDSGEVGRGLAGYWPVLLSSPGPVFGSDACADVETNRTSEGPPTSGPGYTQQQHTAQDKFSPPQRLK